MFPVGPVKLPVAPVAPPNPPEKNTTDTIELLGGGFEKIKLVLTTE